MSDISQLLKEQDIIKDSDWVSQENIIKYTNENKIKIVSAIEIYLNDNPILLSSDVEKVLVSISAFYPISIDEGGLSDYCLPYDKERNLKNDKERKFGNIHLSQSKIIQYKTLASAIIFALDGLKGDDHIIVSSSDPGEMRFSYSKSNGKQPDNPVVYYTNIEELKKFLLPKLQFTHTETHYNINLETQINK